MKFIVTMKSPDALADAINRSASEQILENDDLKDTLTSVSSKP